MPPKPKITKSDIVSAGFNVVRKNGPESLNVRAIAGELGCSTQPIMSHYKNAEELKADIYALANSIHTEYIMKFREDEEPLLTLGQNYIKFAAKEKNLFKFLFQTDRLGAEDFTGLFADEKIKPLLEVVSEHSGLGGENVLKLFKALFICAHGFASLLANNSTEYDENFAEEILFRVYDGVSKDMEG